MRSRASLIQQREGHLTPDVDAQVRDKLPLLTAAAVGFQHAVAMVGGIIVPALIISSASADDSNRACECEASSHVQMSCVCVQFSLFMHSMHSPCRRTGAFLRQHATKCTLSTCTRQALKCTCWHVLHCVQGGDCPQGAATWIDRKHLLQVSCWCLSAPQYADTLSYFVRA